MAKLHVLVVDDTPANLAITEAYLEPLNPEICLTLAQSGQEAITKSQQQSFDIVFMDVEMPGIDGFQAAQRLRDLSNLINTPIIAMTGHDAEHIKKNNLAHNFDGFLGKPFIDRQLIELINHHCLTKFPIKALQNTRHTTTSEYQQLSQNASVLDINGMKQRLNNNTKLMVKVLDSFGDNNRETYTKFYRAITQHNWALAQRIAHTLKGGGANIGATELSTLGSTLEQLCINRVMPSQSQLATLKNTLQQTLEHARTASIKLVEEIKNHQLHQNNNSSSPLLVDELKEVLHLLQTDVGAAQDTLDDIAQHNANNLDIQQMVALFNQFQLDQLRLLIESYLATDKQT